MGRRDGDGAPRRGRVPPPRGPAARREARSMSIVRARRPSARRCSAVRSTPGNPCRHAEAQLVHRVRRGGDRRHRGGGRGRQDGPAARRAVRRRTAESGPSRAFNPEVVATINAADPTWRRAGLAELVSRRHARGPAACHPRCGLRRPRRDVVVLIVPVMSDAEKHSPTKPVHGRGPSRRSRPESTPEPPSSSRRRSPRRTTRRRFAPALERPRDSSRPDFFVAFSPERLFSGAVLENLAVYPSSSAGSARRPTAARRASMRACSTRRSWR